ncbi:hypothetical protein BCON_0003g00420 [Botryotinia convoluta]|uniref:Uncharacterized protein n=1 Tax=Botryotinia convoluta TaxID=54673 RepID=A0A4Z1IUV6_9HELO|nr:hypothetical protein BCON_0003g00420 [Botryotinia convoluta]
MDIRTFPLSSPQSKHLPSPIYVHRNHSLTKIPRSSIDIKLQNSNENKKDILCYYMLLSNLRGVVSGIVELELWKWNLGV